jgi:hypothetical protein
MYFEVPINQTVAGSDTKIRRVIQRQGKSDFVTIKNVRIGKELQ